MSLFRLTLFGIVMLIAYAYMFGTIIHVSGTIDLLIRILLFFAVAIALILAVL